jgi:hypothetical protein
MRLQELRDTIEVAKDQLLWAASSLQTLRSINEETVARVDKTYAAHSFNRISQALEHDAALALSRLWDKSRGALNLQRIFSQAEAFRSDIVEFSQQAEEQHASKSEQRNKQAAGLDKCSLVRLTKRRLDETAEKVDELLDSTRGLLQQVHSGDHKEPRDALIHFRNKFLAHRQVEIRHRPESAQLRNPRGSDIDNLVSLSADIIEDLYTLANRDIFSLKDFLYVEERYARAFWSMLEQSRKRQGE